jgi:hypothetical protein
MGFPATCPIEGQFRVRIGVTTSECDREIFVSSKFTEQSIVDFPVERREGTFERITLCGRSLWNSPSDHQQRRSLLPLASQLN